MHCSGGQVIIAWGIGTIVICFRGTASMKNVLHDLKAWKFSYCGCSLPMRTDRYTQLDSCHIFKRALSLIGRWALTAY